MAIQNWSDKIIMADLADDPELTDDLVALAERLEQEPKDTLINFAAVRFLNSSNISRLLKLRKIILDSNKRLCLCGIAIQVWGVFLLTGLDSLFDVVEDTSTALASLQIK
jgi:anti-anti-sigma factor